MTRRCRRCVLPETVPGADFDAGGVCAFCRTPGASQSPIAESRRAAFEQDLERSLRECRGKAEYDCIVSLSGGKDSLYLLHRVVRDYGLNPLAYTLDFDIPAPAWSSIRRTVKTLGVKHLVDTPSPVFYRKFIRHLLLNQHKGGAVETVCYVLAPLRDGGVIRLAADQKIPLVLVGYSPNQPDPYAMQYEIRRELIAQADWTPKDLKDSGSFTAEELAQFWNPFKYPAGTAFPRFLAPFHAWKYDQGEVIRRVVSLGLAENAWSANPVRSNFTMNWLLMYSDLKNLGYNPYAPEFSKLIREGKASRGLWWAAGPFVNFMLRRRVLLGKNVSRWLTELDLKPEDLKIRPDAPVSAFPAR